MTRLKHIVRFQVFYTLLSTHYGTIPEEHWYNDLHTVPHAIPKGQVDR